MKNICKVFETNSMRIWKSYQTQANAHKPYQLMINIDYRSALANSWAESKKQEANADKAKYVPIWADFGTFIDDEIKVHAMEDMRQAELSPIYHKMNKVPSNRIDQNNLCKNQGQYAASTSSTSELQPLSPPCLMCGHPHWLYQCVHFNTKFSLFQKWRFIEEKNLCKKCTRRAHGTAPCDTKGARSHCPKCFDASGKMYWHNSKLCSFAHGLAPGIEWPTEEM